MRSLLCYAACRFNVESIRLKVKRIALPREITDLVLFLASERASFVNGENITIDGGQMKSVLSRLVFGRKTS